MRHHRSKSIPLALASLVLVAAIPARAADAIVHPLAEIVARGPAFTDLGPTSVTVRLDTTIPVACSAVYGPNAAFGAIATDTDMAGGGHTHHHPLLGGLVPDTSYQVRLQGTGPDGTLYVSDTYTIHTPAAAPAAANPLGRDVALASAGARVTATSSNYGGAAMDARWGGNAAIDGDPATEWSSNGDGDAAWIEIDLGRPTAITGIGLKTRTMGSSAQIEAFRVVTDAGATLGPFEVPDANALYPFAATVTARILRIEVVRSNGGNTGVGEIEVYAR